MNFHVGRVQRPAAVVVIFGVLAAALAGPAPVRAAEADSALTATLDGRPIPLEDVGRYHCDDFSYPEIRCWSTRVLADSRALLVTLLTSVDYVTIYDLTGFGGASMNVSADYPALSSIGWNDRVSSFKSRNSETGTLFVDWFYGGSWYAFCCDTSVSSLGSFNNTFSSIQRT